MAKLVTTIALVGLALSPFAATSLAAIPLGATAAATQPTTRSSSSLPSAAALARADEHTLLAHKKEASAERPASLAQE